MVDTDKQILTYPIPLSGPSTESIHRATKPLIHGNIRLCSVLEHIAGNPIEVRSTLHRLPWFTPIVGSGCLQLGNGPTIALKKLERVVQDEVKALELAAIPDLPPPDAIATDFASLLLRTRTHDAPFDKRPTGGEEGEDGEQGAAPTQGTARLTLLTAILTRLHHLGASRAFKPMSRLWISDHVLFTEGDPHETALLKMAIKILRSMLAEPVATPYSDAVTLLLRRIDSDLARMDDQKLFVLDLRMLTELTWILLISETSIYPGWSDLLLELLLELTKEEGSLTGYRPRIQELWELDNNLARLLIRPTILSWKARQDPEPLQPREEFYSAIAELLRTQAALHSLLHFEDTGSDDDEDYDQVIARRVGLTAVQERLAADVEHKRAVAKRDRKPSPPAAMDVKFPYPAAFVTSFDLELEAALWGEGRPFRVVIPVFSASHGDIADLVWITALIDPVEDRNLPYHQDYDPETSGGLLEYDDGDWPQISVPDDLHVLRAAARDWRVAEKDIAATGEEHGGKHPIVVRVTGSPLMVLPPVEGALKSDFENHLQLAEEEERSLRHALAIDEYTSVRQAEHELFFAARNQARGLPIGLSTGAGSIERVWVGFGVQVDDPAIRLRMFSQLSAASIKQRVDLYAKGQDGSTDEDDEDGPEHSVGSTNLQSNPLAVKGLAVNRRIDEDQSTALQWLGFKFVVDSSAADLIPDVNHCTDHYRHIQQVLGHLEAGTDIEKQLDWARPMEKTCDLWKAKGRKR